MDLEPSKLSTTTKMTLTEMFGIYHEQGMKKCSLLGAVRRILEQT